VKAKALLETATFAEDRYNYSRSGEEDVKIQKSVRSALNSDGTKHGEFFDVKELELIVT
jgi:hypothetical protein